MKSPQSTVLPPWLDEDDRIFILRKIEFLIIYSLVALTVIKMSLIYWSVFVFGQFPWKTLACGVVCELKM